MDKKHYELLFGGLPENLDNTPTIHAKPKIVGRGFSRDNWACVRALLYYDERLLPELAIPEHRWMLDLCNLAEMFQLPQETLEAICLGLATDHPLSLHSITPMQYDIARFVREYNFLEWKTIPKVRRLEYMLEDGKYVINDLTKDMPVRHANVINLVYVAMCISFHFTFARSLDQQYKLAYVKKEMENIFSLFFGWGFNMENYRPTPEWEERYKYDNQ